LFRFEFESKVFGFDWFAVIGANFSDESGGHDNAGRICIATATAPTVAWIDFMRAWGPILHACGRTGEFHANRGDATQKQLNLALAAVMREMRIPSLCMTIKQDTYRKVTTPKVRSQYGNAFGFARYCSLMITSQALEKVQIPGHFGYYVEQGGKGFSWIMERLAQIYRSDMLRARFRMAYFGPVDRRTDLPAHPPDLVSHEVNTARHNSPVLKILDDLVEVQDISEDDASGLLDLMLKDREVLDRILRDSLRDLRQKRKHK
jgi:hypothetical protein